MAERIDCRGLSCPQPVILTKRVMDKGETEVITIVDNLAARDNVSKLAASQGFGVEIEEENGIFTLHMTRSGESAKGSADADEVAILIKSNLFGTGEEELGNVLMKSFLYSLNEVESRITHLIFMNSGVFLTTEGSLVLDHLKALEEKGVEILSCGTCLDFYGRKDKLAVGKVTNMYTAMDIMTSASKGLVF